MDLKEFFKNEVKPALGCTETGAVAFAASAGSEYLDEPVERIHLRLSPNIYKNGKNVGIPGTSGLRGNLLAAALGAIGGDSKKGLESLSGITPDDISQSQELLARGGITQEVINDVPTVYVEAELWDKKHRVTAVISERHDLLVEVLRDGQTVKVNEETKASLHLRPSYIKNLIRQDMNSLWNLAGKIDSEIEAFLLSGVEMNLKIARLGLKCPWGLGAGFALKKNVSGDDPFWKVKMFAAAAADVRMDGGTLPVMSSGGSGNHGITAILPAAVVAEAWKKSPRELAESVALSHLLTGYIKAHTGVLSPVCGCVVAAGLGATVSIVRLKGGTPDQGQTAASSLMASLLGMVCDGAKTSCALKVSTAAGEAYINAMMAMSGYGVTDDQGIISFSLPKMARAVETLSKIGMSTMDSTILQLMQEQDTESNPE